MDGDGVQRDAKLKRRVEKKTQTDQRKTLNWEVNIIISVFTPVG